MIRLAREADIPSILKMGRQFFDAAGWPAYAEWNEESVARLLNGLVGGSIEGGLLVAERESVPVGMAGFLCFPFYFNFAVKAAQELFWYVDPSHRGGVGAELLSALETAARSKGVEVFIVAAVAAMRSEVVARMYERRGYLPAENTFIKRLAA